MEGARDWGEGWRVASEALECAHAVTAVDFAPSVLQDERSPSESYNVYLFVISIM